MRHQSEQSVDGASRAGQAPSPETSQLRRPRRGRSSPVDGLVERLVINSGTEMLRVARRHSVSAADAEDAFQRALEKLLTRAPNADEDRLRAWLLSVVRNEALTIVRGYRRRGHQPFDEALAGHATSDSDLAEGLVDAERLTQGGEALKRISADQMRCLLLRADGFGYDEICERTGFSYPKVNRCLTEGRKAFHGRVSMIADGSECRRLEPVLSRIADGVANPRLVEDAEIHLQNCLACRQTLIDFRLTPSDVAALLPVGLALPHGGWTFARIGEIAQNSVSALQERFAQLAPLHQGTEMAFAKKAAATAAVAAALAGGGIAVERVGLLPDGGSHAEDSSANLLPGPSGVTPGSRKAPPSSAEPGPTANAARRTEPRAARQSDVVGGNLGRAGADAPSETPDRSGMSAGDPDQAVIPPPEVTENDSQSLAPGDNPGLEQVP